MQYTLIINDHQRRLLAFALAAAASTETSFTRDEFENSAGEIVSDYEEAEMLCGMLRDMPALEKEAPGAFLHDFTA